MRINSREDQPDGLAAAELRGTLSGGSLSIIVRFLLRLGKTGWLHVAYDSTWRGGLYFQQGRLTSANFGPQVGLAALDELTLLPHDATFDFNSGEPAPLQRSIDLAPDEVLERLERQAARAATVWAILPGLTARPRRVEQTGQEHELVGDAGGTLQTLLAVDGRHTVAEIAAARGSFGAVGHLARLAELGLVRFDSSAESEPASGVGVHVPSSHESLDVLPDPLVSGVANVELIPPSGTRSESFGQLRRQAVNVAPMGAEAAEFAEPVLAARQWLQRVSWRTVGTLIVAVALAVAGGVLVTRWSNETRSGAQAPDAVVALPTKAVNPGRALTDPVRAATVSTSRGPTIVPARAPAVAMTRTLLDETFASNDHGWPNDALGPAWLEGNLFHLAARQTGGFVAVAAPLTEVVGDATVSATFRKVGGPSGGAFGIILRDHGPGPRDGINQSGRYYVVEVSDTGQVGLWRRDNDVWAEVLPWTRSDAVRPGMDTNDLTVRSIGNALTVDVNGSYVATRTDDTLAYGRVGLFVGGDANEIVVEHFTVLAPGQ